MSRTGLRLITFDRVVPHLPQITSVDGYDITISPSKRSSKTILSKSIDQQSQEQKCHCYGFNSNATVMYQSQKNDIRDAITLDDL
jgi:hypothetical protein